MLLQNVCVDEFLLVGAAWDCVGRAFSIAIDTVLQLLAGIRK